MTVSEWLGAQEERRFVRWDDASDCHVLFTVWVNRADRLWARRSWELLEAQGMTEYADDVERWRVLVRLVALSVFYQLWCSVVWGEPKPSVAMLLGDLEIPTDDLVALCGDPTCDEEECDVRSLCTEVLRGDLFPVEYQSVLAGIRQGYDGDEGLYASLVLSNDRDWSGRWPLPDARYNAAANAWNVDLATGFSWLTNGAELFE